MSGQGATTHHIKFSIWTLVTNNRRHLSVPSDTRYAIYSHTVVRAGFNAPHLIPSSNAMDITTVSLPTRLRFLPLCPTSAPPPTTAPPLTGVIFDVDGTLTLPQPWMFTKMRSLLGVLPGTDILTHVSKVADPPASMALIKRIEDEGMLAATIAPGVEPLLNYLTARGIRKAILTRNYASPVSHLLSRHLGLRYTFDPIVTREFYPPKPEPHGIRHIAGLWGCDTRELLMIGDSIDDMAAGRRAGAATVLVGHSGNGEIRVHEFTDYVVESLDQLIEVLENGLSEVIRPREEVREQLEDAKEVLAQ